MPPAAVAGDGPDQALRALSHRHGDPVRPDAALPGVGQHLAHGTAVAIAHAQAPIDIAGGGVGVEVEVKARVAGAVHQSQEIQVHRLPPAPVDAAQIKTHGPPGGAHRQLLQLVEAMGGHDGGVQLLVVAVEAVMQDVVRGLIETEAQICGTLHGSLSFSKRNFRGRACPSPMGAHARFFVRFRATARKFR